MIPAWKTMRSLKDVLPNLLPLDQIGSINVYYYCCWFMTKATKLTKQQKLVIL